MAQAVQSPKKLELELEAVIGYAGSVPNGLLLHNDDKRIIYGLGSTVVIKPLLENTQQFLQCGNSESSVSCMALNKDGTLLATAQQTYPGFPASIWVWDLTENKIVHKLDCFKSKIQALAFSPSGKYLASLGGEDDNNLIMWDVKTGDAICGSPAANDTALCLAYANQNDNMLVTAGKYNLRVWQFDRENRKVRPTNCKLGSLKRVINCVTIDPTDEIGYAGTASGDLLQISLKHTLFQLRGPPNKPFSMGIQSVILTQNGNILVGAGDGVVALLDKKTLKIIRKTQFEGLISSLALNKGGDHFFVGSNKSMMWLVKLDDFDFEQRKSAHYSKINDVCFAEGCSELFVTAAVNDIRVWNARTLNELLRIRVPNLECESVTLSKDGSTIMSGWNDGKVRAFYPQSGRLKWTIHNAHKESVTALALTSDGATLVTGGSDAKVRVWSISKEVQKMVVSLGEHKSAITSIQINSDDTEFLTSSHDGSCVVWDATSHHRINAMFASTQFSTILYHPDESQLLTTGTDRQITYFDASDVSAIRIIDGSESGAINSLSISNDGEYFVSAGDDHLVKLWHYDEGEMKAIGVGHSGAITALSFAPDGKSIVSVGTEGAVMVWKIPDLSQNQAASSAVATQSEQ